MLTKIEKQQVACLRNFLVPKEGPDRLVKNWRNTAETDDGFKVRSNGPGAERFCVLGGWIHLYPDSMKLLAPELDRVSGYFNTAVPHTAEEIRELLNKLIEGNKMKANLGPGSGTNKVVIKKGELVTKPFGTNGKKTHTRRAKSFKGSKGGLGI